MLTESELISIHVPREGHDANTDKRERLIKDISIHVPREGHDLGSGHVYPIRRIISIHVPREGHDHSGDEGLF